VVTLRAAATWSAPLLLMAVIYGLSDQPNLGTGLGLIDLVGRKLVHMMEFGALSVLWWRALRTTTDEASALRTAAGIALLYAVLDELHQGFVFGRTASVWDVAIDALGVGIACLLVLRRTRSLSPARAR